MWSQSVATPSILMISSSFGLFLHWYLSLLSPLMPCHAGSVVLSGSFLGSGSVLPVRFFFFWPLRAWVTLAGLHLLQCPRCHPQIAACKVPPSFNCCYPIRVLLRVNTWGKFPGSQKDQRPPLLPFYFLLHSCCSHPWVSPLLVVGPQQTFGDSWVLSQLAVALCFFFCCPASSISVRG